MLTFRTLSIAITQNDAFTSLQKALMDLQIQLSSVDLDFSDPTNLTLLDRKTFLMENALDCFDGLEQEKARQWAERTAPPKDPGFVVLGEPPKGRRRSKSPAVRERSVSPGPEVTMLPEPMSSEAPIPPPQAKSPGAPLPVPVTELELEAERRAARNAAKLAAEKVRANQARKEEEELRAQIEAGKRARELDQARKLEAEREALAKAEAEEVAKLEKELAAKRAAEAAIRDAKAENERRAAEERMKMEQEIAELEAQFAVQEALGKETAERALMEREIAILERQVAEKEALEARERQESRMRGEIEALEREECEKERAARMKMEAERLERERCARVVGGVGVPAQVSSADPVAEVVSVKLLLFHPSLAETGTHRSRSPKTKSTKTILVSTLFHSRNSFGSP